MSIETKDSKSPVVRAATTELDAPRGFIPAITTLAVDAGELAATTALGVGADVRTELARSALAVLDAGEALVKSGFAVARRLTQRLDTAATELLTGVEKIVGTSAGAARTTTRDAAQVVAGAVNAVVAPRGN